jgi:hypothetical protein
LLVHHADANARDQEGTTPLFRLSDHADCAGHTRIDAAGQSIETERTLAAKRQVAGFLRKKGGKSGADLGPMPSR